MIQEPNLNDRQIADNLNRLPQSVPEKSAWLEIQNRLESFNKTRRKQSILAAYSIAAGVCCVILIGWFSLNKPPYQNHATKQAIQYSQSLEKKLHTLSQQNNLNSVDKTILVTELEDMIALVDYQINQDELTHNYHSSLWQQRIELMESLIALQSNSIHKTAYQNY